MIGHSPLAPSSAARTVQCYGSVRMQQRYPEVGDKPEAAEGEAAHWCFAEMAEGVILSVGQQAPDGVFIDREMLDGAGLMLADIIQTLGPTWRDHIHVEEPLPMPGLHPLAWGTPDAWALVGDKLYVWDFKYGHGFVEVFENWQLLCYVKGVAEKHQIDGATDQFYTVHMTIVQPRSYHREGPVRKWSQNLAMLRSHFNILSCAFHEAMATPPAQGPRLRVGPECDYCSARHACPELQRQVMRDADFAAAATPFDLSPAAVGGELAILKRAIARLEARATGLEQQALAFIKSGTQIPHWAAEYGVGRECWTRPTAEILMLGTLMGKDLAKPVDPITPKQAIAAGLSPDVVRKYSTTPHGALKLVPDDGSKARQVFAIDGNVTNA